MSGGVSVVSVHENLKLDKRKGSDNWYARTRGTRNPDLVLTNDVL